ncbi:hypothetical protein PENSPDRAFT_554740, partial [Peniophora sp. CONT]
AWREIFLSEEVRAAGPGEARGLTQCPGCGGEGFPEYRCVDCRGADLCKDCTVHWHKYSPLHQLERYNGEFYERTCAADMGMRIQLMHRPGEMCAFRTLHPVEKFTVAHTNGIHVIPVDFCFCELGRDVPRHIQLMRYRFWPATCENPQTATTHEALDQFTRLQLLGRLNIYDYYKAIEAATDGALLRGIANVRQQVSNCVRQFRHITMFKRAGRGHEEGGIAGTPPGACAVRCPACPNFDTNVPLDWASRPFRCATQHSSLAAQRTLMPPRWLYSVILALDANFRLSNKLTRSTNKTDPNLTDGKAYMAPRKDYGVYIKQTERADREAKPSDCSRFGALNMANQRGGKGLRTTGVGGCFCARHEIVQPLGMATLRRGERYSTMDWIFCGALSFVRAAMIVVSYDIACQWSKNLVSRVKKIKHTRTVWQGAKTFLALANEHAVKYVVPKFHLYAHKMYCQLRYAFGRLLGTGATDGEGCERVWAGANPAAPSLREMGPGGMSDVMDDMCGAWNWAKVCGIGKLLNSRMDRALDEGTMQTNIFTEFTEALEAEDPQKLGEWRRKLAAWDGDELKKEGTECPYHVEKECYRGTTVSCIISVLRLSHHRIRVRLATKHQPIGGTVKQATARTQALNALLHTIANYREEQEYLMSDVYATLTADERDPDRSIAMTVKLYLPSDPPDHDTTLVTAAARSIESKLRWASMADELDNLRHQLRLKGVLNKHKLAQISGQRGCTRARGAQEAVAANVKRAADAYRRHRKAYLALEGEGEWEKTMCDLLDAHCRGLGDRLLEQMEEMSEYNVQQFLAGRRGADSSGETKYELPWIWFSYTEESGLEITDGALKLMVEWAKSRARAQHWVEEVRLLAEEMRRVIAHNESLAKIWDQRREPEHTVDLGDKHQYATDAGWRDGVRAYACKQAFIRRAQAENWRNEFAETWRAAETFLA